MMRIISTTSLRKRGDGINALNPKLKPLFEREVSVSMLIPDCPFSPRPSSRSTRNLKVNTGRRKAYRQLGQTIVESNRDCKRMIGLGFIHDSKLQGPEAWTFSVAESLNLR